MGDALAGLGDGLAAAAWPLSRASGFAAFAALSFAVVLGLGASTRLADRWLPQATVLALHQWVSGLGLLGAASHAALLLPDRFVAFELRDVVVPFVSSYRPGAVGLGVVVAWGALLVHLSFALRARLGPRAFQALHSLSLALFGLAAIHGLAAGTDGAQPLARLVYATPMGLVLALLAVRAAQWVRAAKEGKAS